MKNIKKKKNKITSTESSFTKVMLSAKYLLKAFIIKKNIKNCSICKIANIVLIKSCFAKASAK